MQPDSIEIWIDAQLPPTLANFIRQSFNISSKSLKEIGLRDADDRVIFNAAREKNAIILTKDSDFVDLIIRFNSPPKVIWITCGNTSNDKVKKVLKDKLLQVLELLSNPENDIVEISD